MTDRNEWERDAVAWLAGRWIEGKAASAPFNPCLERAAAGFRAWRAAADREAEAERFARRVTRRVAALGRGVRRVEHAPEAVRATVAGPLACVVAAARGTGAAPLAELGVAAGSGRELFDEPCDTWVALPPELPPSRYVALRVVGDSMTPLLHSEDVVLVDLDGTVPPGVVAVAHHPEHGYVVKRVSRVDGARQGALLVSLNPAYPPLELRPGTGALLGPVVLRWCAHGTAKPGLATRP
jgi:phage repressor protein C with HTH and peptisase S24 domain